MLFISIGLSLPIQVVSLPRIRQIKKCASFESLTNFMKDGTRVEHDNFCNIRTQSWLSKCLESREIGGALCDLGLQTNKNSN